METCVLSEEKGLNLAVQLLKEEKIVALPTETVYGLAGDAFSPRALVSIFEAKERPLSDPLIVHLLDLSWLDRVVRLSGEMKALVDALAHAFWPGPLTLLLPRNDTLPSLVTAGLDHVAVRVPSHPFFRKILSLVDRPLAAPSANQFGRISPTRACDVFEELQGNIPLILDGGACLHGLESTILWPRVDGSTSLSAHASHLPYAHAKSVLQILRPGPITADMLAPFGDVLVQSVRGKAPGSLDSHYAPRKKLFWYEHQTIKDANIGVLAFSTPPPGCKVVEVLSPLGDLVEAAANLYGALRRLDESKVDFLLVEPVPIEGIGMAIMDRLQRAVSA